MIFVFGSNEAGIHGAGAARVAVLHYGAVYGKGNGAQGRAYAIPTKGSIMHRGKPTVGLPLPLERIASYVQQFICYATENTELQFKVTQIGCGHARFNAEDIAPMFRDAPSNCFFDTAWEAFLPNKNFWGTQ